VVGNITVGGTGKTPLVIALVSYLEELGLKPGVISRGYGGDADAYPLWVDSQTSYKDCGDEPKLIQNRTKVPLVVGPNRQHSIELMQNRARVDVIISDDGLQHFALQRDLEICISDNTQTDTNGHCLPAGPLREPLSRLKHVDLNVSHVAVEDNLADYQGATMYLEPASPICLSADEDSEFVPENGLHAVAGIGNPVRFFNTCSAMGWEIERHPFDDHYSFVESDFDFPGTTQILMTEKDAVKCHEFASDRLWYLPVDAKISENLKAQLLLLLKQKSIISN
jgi:tetraacyldisaccharide 4'-kinase